MRPLLLLLPLLFLSTNPLYPSPTEIEQPRDHQTQEDEHHRLNELVDLFLPTVAPSGGTLKIVFWAEVTIAVTFRLPSFARPLLGYK